MQAVRILRQMEGHLTKPTDQKEHQSKYVHVRWGNAPMLWLAFVSEIMKTM